MKKKKPNVRLTKTGRSVAIWNDKRNGKQKKWETQKKKMKVAGVNDEKRHQGTKCSAKTVRSNKLEEDEAEAGWQKQKLFWLGFQGAVLALRK